MSLQTQEINLKLTEGFRSLPFRKEGIRSTLYAQFSEINSPISARLEHNAGGEDWADIDESVVEIAANDHVYTQAWTENVLPEGTMLRLVVEPTNAILSYIKYLSA